MISVHSIKFTNIQNERFVQKINLIPDPVAKIRTVEYSSGGEIRSTSKPLPITCVTSTTSPLRSPQSSSAVDPATLFTRNSNSPLAAENEGGDATARNDGFAFSASGSRSCRYWPACVWDAATSGVSETSMVTWKR